jgi:acyl-CoA synthetase (AMP-forming)/AMP-acid ligase II
MCSSGPTGEIKDICKSHKQVITYFTPPLGTNSPEVNFTPSGIHWFNGMNFLIMSILYNRTRIIMKNLQISLQLFIDIINEYKVTEVLLLPMFTISFLQHKGIQPLESIKKWFIAGSFVSQELCEDLKPFIPNGNIINLYGTTEMNILAANPTGRKYASVGYLLNQIEAKVTI